MCGICGAFSKGKITSYEIRHVQDLLVLNHFRGEDSVGMFDYTTGTKENSTLYWKELTHPIRFAKDNMEGILKDRWDKNNTCSPRMLTCHARAATIGKVSVKNTHPFWFTPVIGVHNGTIHGEFKHRKKFETDSEAIIYNISLHGIEDTVEMLYKEITLPAFALVIFDVKTKELHLIRNHQRPLNIYYRNQVVYFSSEARDLAYVFDLEQKPGSLLSAKDEAEKGDYGTLDGINSLKPMVLYTVSLSKTTEDKWTMKALKIPVKTYPAASMWKDRRDQDLEGGYDGYSVEGRFRQKFRHDNYQGSFDRQQHQTQSKPPDPYLQHWWDSKTFTEAQNLGDRYMSGTHKHYDLVFERWFNDFQIKCIGSWIEKHPIVYVENLRRVWSVLTPDKQKSECNQAEVSINSIKKILRKAVKPSGIFPLIQRKEEEKAKEEEVEEDRLHAFGKNGGRCSTTRYKEILAAAGCGWCTTVATVNDPVFWVDNESYLCATCQEDILTDPKHVAFNSFNLDGLKEHFQRYYGSKRGLLETDQGNI